MRLVKSVPLLLSILVLCTDPLLEDKNPTISPFITLENTAYPVWYRDPFFEETIYPSLSNCVPGHICCFITFGPWDYTCTLLPDTFWGIIEYDLYETDTVICYSDTARSLHDTTKFCLKNYLELLSYAICSNSAVAYTKSGINYTFSPEEGKLHIKNSCFDTVFYSSFSIPSIPLDTQKGVWFESANDTIFCPNTLIDSLSGKLAWEKIREFTKQSNIGYPSLQ